jgi:hypothetical protein
MTPPLSFTTDHSNPFPESDALLPRNLLAFKALLDGSHMLDVVQNHLNQRNESN